MTPHTSAEAASENWIGRDVGQDRRAAVETITLPVNKRFGQTVNGRRVRDVGAPFCYATTARWTAQQHPAPQLRCWT
jgi:hypothetical protein